jgi:hypothetical protein
MAKKPATQAEKDHMGAVAELPCCVCGRIGVHVHHIGNQGMRASAYQTIPLCPFHHMDGGFGDAVHQGRRTWESRHGTEKELLSKTLKQLKIQA